MTSSAISYKQAIPRESQALEPKSEQVGFMEKGYKIKQTSPSFGTCCRMVVNAALFVFAAGVYFNLKCRSA